MKQPKPIKFKEANVNFVADNCGDLPALKLENQIIQCWKIPFWQRIYLLFTGNVWTGIMGQSQPPMYITINKPFNTNKEK